MTADGRQSGCHSGCHSIGFRFSDSEIYGQNLLKNNDFWLSLWGGLEQDE
jgi:hypothetical protein